MIIKLYFSVTTDDGACFVYGKNIDNRLFLGQHVNEATKFTEVAENLKVAKMVIGPTHSGNYLAFFLKTESQP